MKLLLDTHIWIWSLTNPEMLTHRVARAVRSARNSLWLSPLSVFEFLVLTERGRVALKTGSREWIERAFQELPVKEAPLTTEVALASRGLELGHRDPVDILLAATAKLFDLTLVTEDERLLEIKGIPLLPNR